MVLMRRIRSVLFNRRKDLFRDEEGFTTTSMVLSLLVTLALLFTSAQVYRIQTASAEVQDVADAAALAAENQVAEFMLVARFCDAVVLSLSLTGITVTGLGIAALCTPVTASISDSVTISVFPTQFKILIISSFAVSSLSAY